MFFIDPNTNQKYYPGVAFSYGGFYYTSKAATNQKFLELGFTQVVVQTRPNTLFYDVTGPDNTGTYTSIPKDLAVVKAQLKLQEKTQAHSILRQTDWYVIRNVELGAVAAAIPSAISTYREAVRTAVSTRCTAIDACTTIQELETLYLNGTGVDLPEELDETYGVY